MSSLAPIIYTLCLLSSGLCAWLLIRSYIRTHTRLLLWSAACFVLLALNNFLVVLDLMILPTVDLSLLRNICAFVAVAVLIYGFIWELD